MSVGRVPARAAPTGRRPGASAPRPPFCAVSPAGAATWPCAMRPGEKRGRPAAWRGTSPPRPVPARRLLLQAGEEWGCRGDGAGRGRPLRADPVQQSACLPSRARPRPRASLASEPRAAVSAPMRLSATDPQPLPSRRAQFASGFRPRPRHPSGLSGRAEAAALELCGARGASPRPAGPDRRQHTRRAPQRPPASGPAPRHAPGPPNAPPRPPLALTAHTWPAPSGSRCARSAFRTRIRVASASAHGAGGPSTAQGRADPAGPCLDARCELRRVRDQERTSGRAARLATCWARPPAHPTPCPPPGAPPSRGPGRLTRPPRPSSPGTPYLPHSGTTRSLCLDPGVGGFGLFPS